MKKLHIILFLLAALQGFAQYGYRDGNRIGIYAGVNQSSLMTSNFNTQPEMGWSAGMQVRGNYYNDFSMIYGMQFSENNFTVATLSPLMQKENVEYKLMAVQIRLLLSYNIVKDHVSLDLGPVLQINDKLKFDGKYEHNLLEDNILLTAKDITDITKINGNLYIGFSAGNRRVRALVNYQYGMNNILNNLNNKEELELKTNGDFKGHIGILTGQLLFNL
ncbi:MULTISPECIES: PorT family protein [Flavobacterium]|uniref:PorT family protein n=1 Tax=Flavobacterium TaxID=237 RepID=UPI001FCC794B|nr:MULTISPECIES: PorT family protein [Flavobacterium]UOK43131.1 PorT family protein [Flavobacterium enshiense]